MISGNGELVSRFVLGVDAEKYSGRNARQQDTTQHALDRMISESAEAEGLDRQEWVTFPGGDGELAVLPADVDMVAVAGRFVAQLDDRLAAYNEDHADVMKIRVRVAMHLDTVKRSAMGYAGHGLVVLSRLLEAPELKQALAEASYASLVLLVSEPVYRSVVESGFGGLRPSRFRALVVDNSAKGFRQTAYLFIPGTAAGTGPSDRDHSGRSSQGERVVPGTSAGDVYNTEINNPLIGRNLNIGANRGSG